MYRAQRRLQTPRPGLDVDWPLLRPLMKAWCSLKASMVVMVMICTLVLGLLAKCAGVVQLRCVLAEQISRVCLFFADKTKPSCST
mmetsp:Transcript_39661/g.86405  ORF Transcript_39661/g.86405 Transcript_39661/m.86405 type:complete len:85 (+) Transcript_39661:149-403(+)